MKGWNRGISNVHHSEHKKSSKVWASQLKINKTASSKPILRQNQSKYLLFHQKKNQ